MQINLDNAKKVAELIHGHSRAGNISLYSEAKERGLTFTELLETLDQTPEGSTMDAFERQLFVNEVHLNGNKAISMERFINGNASLLLPELMRREIMKGYRMGQNPESLMATIVPVSGPRVQPIYINVDVNRSFSKRGSGSGASYPKVEFLYRDKEANIIDRGREFGFDYKVLRNQNIAEFIVLLNSIGGQMAADEIDEIYNVLAAGDTASPAAVDVFNGNPGSFTYNDMIHLAMSFDVPMRLTHIIASAADIEKIVGLTPFTDPVAWRETERFNQSGDYKSLAPVNARLVIAPNASSTSIIGINSRFALRESVAQPLMVQAEKVIEQKLEYAVVSKESVYTIMVDGAAKLSDY